MTETFAEYNLSTNYIQMFCAEIILSKNHCPYKFLGQYVDYDLSRGALFKKPPLEYKVDFQLTQSPAKNLTMALIPKFNFKISLVLISMLWYPKYIDI